MLLGPINNFPAGLARRGHTTHKGTRCSAAPTTEQAYVVEEPAIRLTQQAEDQLKRMAGDKDMALRLGVQQGCGCAELRFEPSPAMIDHAPRARQSAEKKGEPLELCSYVMDLEEQDKQGEKDVHIGGNSFPIVSDEESLGYLRGMEVHYVDGYKEGGFKFHNPQVRALFFFFFNFGF